MTDYRNTYIARKSARELEEKRLEKILSEFKCISKSRAYFEIFHHTDSIFHQRKRQLSEKDLEELNFAIKNPYYSFKPLFRAYLFNRISKPPNNQVRKIEKKSPDQHRLDISADIRVYLTHSLEQLIHDLKKLKAENKNRINSQKRKNKRKHRSTRTYSFPTDTTMNTVIDASKGIRDSFDVMANYDEEKFLSFSHALKQVDNCLNTGLNLAIEWQQAYDVENTHENLNRFLKSQRIKNYISAGSALAKVGITITTTIPIP